MDRARIFRIIPIALIAIIAVIVLIAAATGKKKKDDDILYDKVKHPRESIYSKFARFMATFIFGRKAYINVRAKVRTLYPADEATIEYETGKILLPAVLLFVAGLAFPILMFFWLKEFDLFYALSGVLTACVVYKALTNGKLRKTQAKLLEELKESFSRIRHFYHQTGRVDDSIAMAIKESGDVVSPHLDTISDILADPNMFHRTTAYAATHPEKHLLMLLTVCTAIKEYGDRQTADGKPVFLTALGYLKDDIDTECLAIKKKERAFQGVLALILIPLLLIKPLEKWAVTNMPDIGKYYTGLYATVVMVVMFTLTYLVYSVVEMLQDDDQTKERGSSIFAKLATLEPLSSILNNVVENNYTKYLNIDSQLKGTGDHTGVKAFITKRLIFGLLAFIVTLGVTFFGTYANKADILTEFYEDFSSTVSAPEEYKRNMEKASEELVKRHLKDDTVTEESLTAEIKSNYDINTLNATAMAKAILEHKDDYNSRYFTWIYMLIAVIMAFVGSAVPVIMLKLAKKQIEARRQEEVMQFQTLMLILMYVPGTTVASVLEWMERFSTCFLETIITARINLGAGEREALLQMKKEEDYAPFQAFVDNLVAIDKVGIAEAFDEIASDHDYYMQTKKQAKEASIEDKAAIAHMVQMIPLGGVLIMYLLAPIVMFAADMLKTFSATIS